MSGPAPRTGTPLPLLRPPLLRQLPLLLPLLAALSCSVRSQELPSSGVNGYSLHPPYFNLAEGTKITATATCGEEESGRSVEDLYCKLVGGPVSGDPSQTIQVSRTQVFPLLQRIQFFNLLCIISPHILTTTRMHRACRSSGMQLRKFGFEV